MNVVDNEGNNALFYAVANGNYVYVSSEANAYSVYSIDVSNIAAPAVVANTPVSYLPRRMIYRDNILYDRDNLSSLAFLPGSY